jgi:hypothetical protein
MRCRRFAGRGAQAIERLGQDRVKSEPRCKLPRKMVRESCISICRTSYFYTFAMLNYLSVKPFFMPKAAALVLRPTYSHFLSFFIFFYFKKHFFQWCLAPR